MRNAALWGGLLIVVAVLLVGFLILRTPQTATVPTATDSIEEEASSGQLEVEVPTPVITVVASPAPSSSPTTSPASTTGTLITFTDTGIAPSTLTVPVNTTVTFTNNGQGAHWPASDPHPTHTGLPGFDADKALATGESYSFTFTTKGTWGFHDHLNPRLKGSIIVQ